MLILFHGLIHREMLILFHGSDTSRDAEDKIGPESKLQVEQEKSQAEQHPLCLGSGTKR